MRHHKRDKPFDPSADDADALRQLKAELDMLRQEIAKKWHFPSLTPNSDRKEKGE